MIGMTIRGQAELKAKLAAINAGIEAASPEAVKAGSEPVEQTMKSRAPRLTGALISSISTGVQSFGDGAQAKTGADVPYDRYVQRGTIYMMAQPYGEEAADSATAPVVAAMTAVYRAALPN